MLLEDIVAICSSCVWHRRTFDQVFLNETKAFRVLDLGTQEGRRFRKIYILGRSLRVGEVEVYYS